MIVTITTDGSCLGNPGVGGWACILRSDSHERIMEGAAIETTNNRMELTAAIEGLRALTCRCSVRLLTDSEYLRRGAMEFLARWKSNGWRTAAGSAVANRDLWEAIDELSGYHDVTWIHLRGHSGDPDHERCDSLAVEAARRARRESPSAGATATWTREGTGHKPGA
jgi:ribonuclease HI